MFSERKMLVYRRQNSGLTYGMILKCKNWSLNAEKRRRHKQADVMRMFFWSGVGSLTRALGTMNTIYYVKNNQEDLVLIYVGRVMPLRWIYPQEWNHRKNINLMVGVVSGP